MFSTFRLLFPQQQEGSIPQDTFVEAPYFSPLEFSCHYSRLYAPLCFKLMHLLELCCIQDSNHLIVRDTSVLKSHVQFFKTALEDPNTLSLVTEILFHLSVYTQYYYNVFLLRKLDQHLYEMSSDKKHLLHPFFDSLQITPYSFTSWLQRVNIQDMFGFVSSIQKLISFFGQHFANRMLQENLMRYFINFCAVLAYHRNTALTSRQFSAILGEQTIVACLFANRMLSYQMHNMIILSRFRDFEGFSFAHRQLDLQCACVVLLWSGEVLEQMEKQVESQVRSMPQRNIDISYYYNKLRNMRAQFLKQTSTMTEEPISQETNAYIEAALYEKEHRQKLTPFMKLQCMNVHLFKNHVYPDMVWKNYSKTTNKLVDCFIFVQQH